MADQERACSKYAREKGWEVKRVFKEEGESAKTADRTQMLLMKHFAVVNRGKIGYIIVYRTDRFARNQTDHFELRAFFLNC